MNTRDNLKGNSDLFQTMQLSCEYFLPRAGRTSFTLDRKLSLGHPSPRCFLSRCRQATKAALVIQNNYRNYRARPGSAGTRQQAVHQQAAHQAARKIQQFMRQSKIKLVSRVRVYVLHFLLQRCARTISYVDETYSFSTRKAYTYEKKRHVKVLKSPSSVCTNAACRGTIHDR